jgi:hypothetical protein
VSEESRGQIGECYVVHCPCGESAYADHDGSPSSRREAAAQARKMGWRNTRNRGWLCPNCWSTEARVRRLVRHAALVGAG